MGRSKHHVWCTASELKALLGDSLQVSRNAAICGVVLARSTLEITGKLHLEIIVLTKNVLQIFWIDMQPAA